MRQNLHTGKIFSRQINRGSFNSVQIALKKSLPSIQWLDYLTALRLYEMFGVHFLLSKIRHENGDIFKNVFNKKGVENL
jgi:hypothetical protein